MKEIPLTRGFYAQVDDEDYEILNKHKWYAFIDGNVVYARRHEENKNNTIVHMHRLIICAPLGVGTDHIDGNGLNNQKSNLRLATKRRNGQNRHHKKTSRFPGVHFSISNNGWVTQIKIKGIGKYLGTFKTEEEAHTVYRVAEKVLCGE
jgi:hypothetical protein